MNANENNASVNNENNTTINIEESIKEALRRGQEIAESSREGIENKCHFIKNVKFVKQKSINYKIFGIYSQAN